MSENTTPLPLYAFMSCIGVTSRLPFTHVSLSMLVMTVTQAHIYRDISRYELATFRFCSVTVDVRVRLC